MLGFTNYWKAPSTKYGAGQKKARYFKAIGGMDARVFVNKDSPDYKPNYGTQYTKRQQMILNELIPLDQVRLNELTIIIRKAEAMEDTETAAAAQILYDAKTHVDSFQFSMSPEEAKEYLQSLTPWKINWEKEK